LEGFAHGGTVSGIRYHIPTFLKLLESETWPQKPDTRTLQQWAAIKKLPGILKKLNLSKE